MPADLAQTVIDFAYANRGWAFWIALVLAIAETVALVSFLVPTTAILLGLGALVATGALELLPLWAGSALGALIGSTFSFWLGRRYGDAMLTTWPLSKKPRVVRRARILTARRGAVAIGAGHFLSVLRPVVFLLAGASPMRVTTFMAWNVLGCVAWAYLIPKSGELGGDAFGYLWRSLTGGLSA